MAIIIQEASEFDCTLGKENAVKISVFISQVESEEVKQFIGWIIGEVQSTILADWGEGAEILGIVVYNGLTHAAGGYYVRFKSNVKSIYIDKVVDLKLMCTGDKEEEQGTFEFQVLTMLEAREWLRKNKENGHNAKE
jgi:hypothetical protein